MPMVKLLCYKSSEFYNTLNLKTEPYPATVTVNVTPSALHTRCTVSSRGLAFARSN